MQPREMDKATHVAAHQDLVKQLCTLTTPIPGRVVTWMNQFRPSPQPTLPGVSFQFAEFQFTKFYVTQLGLGLALRG